MIHWKALFTLVICAVISTVFLTSESAGALQVKPLLVNEKLKVAEVKKGYIDIANPLSVPVSVKTSVQAFRQIDNQGNLEFYDSKEITAGITPDLDEFELGPREALRMYYLVDGRKLPQGDIFASLFFTANNSGDVSGVKNTARVGTLLVLENGTPGSRKAEIDMSTIPSLQIRDGVRGDFTLTNPADPQKTSGFFPDITLRLAPFTHEVKVDGPLLMAGSSRQVAVSLPNNRIGPYKLTVIAGDTVQSKWLFLITGWWRWVVPIVFIAGLAAYIILKKRRRPRLRSRRSKK